ncbi:hypothetical protein BDZ45DRAFT_216706 [Acephala macrosclerotiorum]|nr:hypothetical protein BDZ45DRAFT_216706 [Acephala macrosclerotiorum]
MEEVRVVRDLRPFTRGQRHQPEALSGKVMQKALDTISTELQSIFHNRRSDMLPRIPIVRGHSDLASLLRYSFEGVTEPRELRKLLAEQISKWGLPMIIRGLTIAAIKEWVFTSDFPNFSRKGDPRLLQQYRKIIAKSDGSTRLHNLEMAAYHAMTEEERFNETNVPRKAEEFADRLSMALAPFFIQADGAPLNGTFASWGQDENQSLDRQFRFKEIFETALRLKAATVTTDETYDFILHPFGTLNKLQESRTGEVISRETRMAKGDLWLHASLVTYEAHPSSARDLFANALVQSNNFSPSCERTDPVRLHTEYLLTPMVLPGQRYGPHSVENNPQRPAAHNTIRTETSRDRTPLNQHRNIVGSKMRNEIPQRIPNSPQKRTHANAFPSSDLPPPLEPAAKRQAQAASSRDQRPAQIQAASPSCLPRSKDNDEVGEYEKTDDSDQAEAAKSLPSSKDHFRCPRCDTPFKTRKKLHSHEEKGKYTKDAV